LVLAANAPDVDVLSYVRGGYFALSFRRGITHGWPALIILPFLVTGVILAWDRLVRRRRDPTLAPVRKGPTLALSALGVLTHPTLDWMNDYGMRWGLPFNGTWSYGDALFIIDPWIWLLLGGSVFLAARPVGRAMGGWAFLLVATSILVVASLPAARVGWACGVSSILLLWKAGLPVSIAARRRLTATACILVTFYIAGLAALDGVARREVREAAAAVGLTARDVMASPVGGNPFTSNVRIATQDSYVPGAHRWLRSPRVTLSVESAVLLEAGPPTLTDGERAEVIERAKAVPAARDYLIWSRYPYVRVEPEGDRWRVRFADARYDGVRGAGGLGGIEVMVAR
jgi:inner membrane protein